ncbi:MAG: hypothetical protein U5R48_15565 [Gammaproteobacteria bacterium]|nr:hypothetical protein [Gammaproteobacteria bacterium]
MAYVDPLGLRTRQQIIDLVHSGQQPEKLAKEFEFIEGWRNPHRGHPPIGQMSLLNYGGGQAATSPLNRGKSTQGPFSPRPSEPNSSRRATFSSSVNFRRVRRSSFAADETCLVFDAIMTFFRLVAATLQE